MQAGPVLRSLRWLPALFLALGLGAPLRADGLPPVDFSHAGYAGGGIPLPSVASKLIVAPSGADDTALLQGAIDELSHEPLGPVGFRGAVVLSPGTYRVSGQLRIRASGIVLRGPGATIQATGISRRTLIEVGSDSPTASTTEIAVTADTPAGAMKLTLAATGCLSVGQRVIVRRPSTKAWISAVGTDRFTGNYKELRLDWLEGSRDLEWDRTIVTVDAATNTVTLDAPITTALEARFGGGTLRASQAQRVSNVGIDGLVLQSEFASSHPLDEEHAWIGIQIDRAEDVWVRDITVRHFVSTAVWIGASARRITVQDCVSEKPVGEDAGWRRFGFYAGGQQILVQRCKADGARQPFLAGLCSGGPNAFLDCTATGATGDSGSIDSWASGVLFDNVRIQGGGLVLGDLGPAWQGAGWNAANSVLWNCSADRLVTDSPAGAANSLVDDPAQPSLYRAQLERRLGREAVTALKRLPLLEERARAYAPSATTPPAPAAAKAFGLQGGRFTVNGRAIIGSASSNAWWKGQTVPARAAGLGWNITRWAPGRSGPGLTEDPEQLAGRLATEGVAMVQVWAGLWYDRRRDDHLTVTRESSEAWAPFYESPWARSGEGRAADGLSRYDLSKFNPWYWQRLRDFADACAAHDMVLYHHFYNHHNLIEAAAHWAEFPWRTANCIQKTDFPEPPPWEKEGTRINVVAAFYDISHPVRREMHRAFILHGLDALADRPNVIHTLGFQFAGPLDFQRFFLDTVAEWEKARGRKAAIVLCTSKEITDAILADPVRAPLVSAVDQRYWQYLADGTLFAPHTDGRMAFRENREAAFGRDAVPAGRPELVYRQVREYADRNPDLAVICGHAGQGPLPVLMAGGAQPLLADYAAAQPLKPGRDDSLLFAFLRSRLTGFLPRMKPAALAGNAWALSDGSRHLFCSLSGETIELAGDMPAMVGTWFDPRTGRTLPAVPADARTMRKPDAGTWLLLLEPRSDVPQ